MSKDKEGLGSEARIALNLHKRPRRRARTWSVGIVIDSCILNLNRVCKTGTPMALLLTYLIPEAASSFYTLLYVGKDANMISIDLTLVRRK